MLLDSSRYFFELAYDGTVYSGWQRQKNAHTIQETIEDILHEITGTLIKIHGCGRTDAGVHASQYFFHADLPIAHSDLVDRLNELLPSDLSILRQFKVTSGANAQKDAIHRSYQYHLSTRKQAFDVKTVVNVLEILDVLKIEQALALLAGPIDFKNFCKRPDQYLSTVCNIISTRLVRMDDHHRFYIEVTANRFLHHMMRLLIGHIIKVGKGRESLEEFEAFLKLQKKPEYFELAPANGLILSKVRYSTESIAGA